VGLAFRREPAKVYCIHQKKICCGTLLTPEPTRSVKYLGVLVGPVVTARDCFRAPIGKIQRATHFMRYRQLPLLRRAALFNVYLISKLIHIAVHYTLDSESKKEIERAARCLFAKAEGRSYFGIALDTLCSNVSAGGLGMKHPSSFLVSCSCRWYNLLCDPQKWKSPWATEIAARSIDAIFSPEWAWCTTPDQVRAGLNVASEARNDIDLERKPYKFLRITEVYVALRRSYIPKFPSKWATLATVNWRNFWKLKLHPRALTVLFKFLWRYFPLPEFLLERNMDVPLRVCKLCNEPRSVHGPTHWFGWNGTTKCNRVDLHFPNIESLIRCISKNAPVATRSAAELAHFCDSSLAAHSLVRERVEIVRSAKRHHSCSFSS
jgi:hypothetical protein